MIIQKHNIFSLKKVKIKCPLHGNFLQKASTHLEGKECIKCGDEKSARKRAKSHEDFINECNKVHYNEYDYSKVKYLSHRKKIIIICKIHGEFEQVGTRSQKRNRMSKM